MKFLLSKALFFLTLSLWGGMPLADTCKEIFDSPAPDENSSLSAKKEEGALSVEKISSAEELVNFLKSSQITIPEQRILYSRLWTALQAEPQFVETVVKDLEGLVFSQQANLAERKEAVQFLEKISLEYKEAGPSVARILGEVVLDNRFAPFLRSSAFKALDQEDFIQSQSVLEMAQLLENVAVDKGLEPSLRLSALKALNQERFIQSQSVLEMLKPLGQIILSRSEPSHLRSAAFENINQINLSLKGLPLTSRIIRIFKTKIQQDQRKN